MKILIIRCYPSYMDILHNTYNIQEIGLAKALVRQGHECGIVFWGDEDKDYRLELDEKLGITIYYRKGKSVLKNAIYPKLDKLIEKYDIIQPAEYNQIESLRLAKKYPNKTIIYHGPYYCDFNVRYNAICKVFDALFLKEYKKRNTAFIAKSRLAKEFLNGKGLNNVKTVGVGVDLDALTPGLKDSEPEFITSVKEAEADIKLLYIGRFEERRNIPFIYETAKKLRDSGLNIKLITIGTGDGDYTDMCRQKAKELGISDMILHTDTMEQKYLSTLYRACDYFLLPTHYEIFGMVLLEAMYYSLPVLTTENGGSDMLIENSIDGFKLSLDIDLWARTVIELNGDKDRYNSVCENAHKKINDFTWDKLSGQFINAYKSVLKE